eukprot:107270-Pleurochrysis_carterae.AAC.1
MGAFSPSSCLAMTLLSPSRPPRRRSPPPCHFKPPPGAALATNKPMRRRQLRLPPRRPLPRRC